METVFSLKSELYDKYRWEYPKKAIQIIKEKVDLNNKSIIADFGAGTGKLTKHFNHEVFEVFAIEPDHNMMNILRKKKLSNTYCIEKYAHEIDEIDSNYIDVIINGHSLHWFEYKKTIGVFRKILKFNGFLVSINNQYSLENDALEELNSKLQKYIVQENIKIKNNDIHGYFLNESIQEWIVPFENRQTFDEMVNALSSASFYPDISYGKIYQNFRMM